MTRLLLTLALLLPGLSFAQLPDDDAIRQAAVDFAYRRAALFSADITPTVDDVINMLNSSGKSADFIDGATWNANVIQGDPDIFEPSLSSATFTTPITNTINTMPGFSIDTGDVIFGSNIWQFFAGGASVTSDRLSVVGAGPGSAGTSASVPAATNDAKLTADIASNATISGIGFTETDPSVTAPTAANVNYYSEIGVDSCIDVFLSGAAQQLNAKCSALNADALGIEIHQAEQRVVFTYEGEIYHTINNAAAFNQLYGAAVITTADSDAFDDALLDIDLGAQTPVEPLWTVLVDQVVNGLDTQAVSSPTNSTGTSHDAILRGDNAVLSYTLNEDTAAANARTGISSVTPIVGSNIEYGISYAFQTLRAYESGSNELNDGAGTAGEDLEIRLTDEAVSYARDGVVFHNSVNDPPPTYPLYPVNYIYNGDDIVRNARLTITPGTLNFTSTLWGIDGADWIADTPETRMPEWSYSGYYAGEIPIPTNTASEIDVTAAPYNAIPDDGLDDTAAFLAALAAVGPGETVYVPNGRYIIRDLLKVDDKGDFTLRGESEAGVTLFIDRYGFELGRTEIDGGVQSFWRYDGGFIWIDGTDTNPADGTTLVESISANAIRGATTITTATDVSGSITVGDWYQVVATDTVACELQNEIYKGVTYTCALELNGDMLLRLPVRVEAVSGTTVTLERELPIDITTVSTPELHEWSPTVTDVGIQDFTIEFEESTYGGHNTSLGYNALIFDACVNCYADNLTILNADYGVHLADDSAFVTIRDVTIGETGAGRGVLTGHHGIISDKVMDVRFEDITFDAVDYVHDLSITNYDRGAVYSRITGPKLNLDHHRMAPYQALFTEIDVGDPSEFLNSGGTATRGPHAGQRITYWGITGSGATFDAETCGFGGGYLYFVAVNTTTNCPGQNWHADAERYISPTSIDPINLYEDQALHLIPTRPTYVVQAPGGYMFDKDAASIARLDLAGVQALIPGGDGRGEFTFPAPYSTLGVLFSDGDVETFEYSYWPKMCGKNGSGVRYVIVPRGAGAEVVTYNEATGVVADVAGLTNMPAGIGGDFECHATDVNKFYYRNGTSMATFDMLTNTAADFWDVAADIAATAPEGLGVTINDLWQRSNSIDDNIHVVSYRTAAGGGDDLGCIAKRLSDGEYFIYEKIVGGLFDECQAGAFDYVIVKDDPAVGGPQHNNYIYYVDDSVSDLTPITPKYTLLDIDGAGGHSDVFYNTAGSYEGFVASDNNDGSNCNTLRRWNFTDNVDTAALVANSGEPLLQQENCSEEAPEHITMYDEGDYYCASSENVNNSLQVSNILYCGTIDPDDTQLLAVAPVPSLNVPGEDYVTAPKCAATQDGEWLQCGGNFGDTSPQNIRIFAVKIPYHKLFEIVNNSIFEVVTANVEIDNQHIITTGQGSGYDTTNQVVSSNSWELTGTFADVNEANCIGISDNLTPSAATDLKHGFCINAAGVVDYWQNGASDTASIATGVIAADTFEIAGDDGTSEVRVTIDSVLEHTEAAVTLTYPAIPFFYYSVAGDTYDQVAWDNNKVFGGGLTDVDWTGETNGATDQGTGDVDCAASCNPAGAYSVVTFASQPASLRFQVVDTTDIYNIGFDASPAGDANALDFSWNMGGTTTAEIRAGGTYLTDTTIADNDVLWIDIDATQARWYRNDTLIHTQATAPTYPIQVDMAFGAVGIVTDAQTDSALKP